MQYKVFPIEKIIAILSYFTFGIIGFLWLILGQIIKKDLRYFLKFHILQSIFIGMLLVVISYCFGFIFDILAHIKFIDAIVGSINYIFTIQLFKILGLRLTLSSAFVWGVIIYLCVGVIAGKIFKIPIISDVVSYHLK